MAAPVRLLELRNTYKWGGGPDKTILLSAEKHDRTRVEVVVVYIRDVRDHEFQITEMAQGRGLTYYEVPEDGKFDPRVLSALRDIIIRHDINMIHGHDYKSDLFAYLVRKWMWRRSIALVSTAHAWVMLGLRGEFYRRLDLFLMKRYDLLLAVSQATKDEMVIAGIPESHINVLYNGIDAEAWAPNCAPESLRTEFSIPLEAPVIGYVGRLMPEKDLKTWLRAAGIVAKQFPTARFVLVGEGRDESTLQELTTLAGSLGIADQVIFPGYRRSLQSVYASFDLFVLSSLREGLPNSILEAMALGLPVVTTDVAGAKELVVHGETGFVVPQEEPESMAQAMLQVLSNKETHRSMGQAGRLRIEQEFSFHQRLVRIEDLYCQTVGQETGRLSPHDPVLTH